MGWEVHHDNSDWSGDAHTTWDSGNSRWDIDGDGVGTLTVAGSWYSGYRPTHIRVDYSGSGGQEILVLDSNGGTLVEDTSYNSLDEIALSFTSYDIASIRMQYLNAQYISNIEFYIAHVGPSGVDETMTVDSGGGDADEFLTISFTNIDELLTVA